MVPKKGNEILGGHDESITSPALGSLGSFAGFGWVGVRLAWHGCRVYSVLPPHKITA